MKENLSFVFDINKSLNQHNVIMVYRGEFTHDVTKAVLNMTERKLDFIGEEEGTKKKVFNVMVECLQNICKHADDVPSDLDERIKPLFIIGKEEEEYVIISGNAIYNEHVDALSEKLRKVNELDKDGLKVFYKEVLTNGSISDKGGAGLGFIDMARKSGNKLVYYFEKVDEQISYFVLKTKISKKKSTLA